MPDDFDPTTITDPTLRAVIQTLMNQVETLHEQNRTQAAEIQRLRDEIARLKGVSIAARNAPATCGNLIHRHAAT
jgi:DNA-binding phage protein